MKRLVSYAAVLALAGAAIAGCDRPKTTSYNNSGASATPGSTTTTTTVTTPTTAPTTSDASSPGTATTAATTTSAPSGEANVVADTVTTGKVKAAFATDPGLKDTDISINTNGGVVVLTGTAKSQDQIMIATNLAQRQEGVTRVDTQVTVK